MGGAKFLGKDVGIPHSAESFAFECFFYWLIGGLLICFFFALIIFSKPNYIIPILVYIFGLVFLFRRYLKIEQGGRK